MKQVIYLRNLDAKSGRNLIIDIQGLEGVTSVISGPQIRDKRSCIITGDITQEVLNLQLNSLGYSLYTPQIAQTENVSQTRIN